MINWSTGRCPCSHWLLRAPAYDYCANLQQSSTAAIIKKNTHFKIIKNIANLLPPQGGQTLRYIVQL